MRDLLVIAIVVLCVLHPMFILVAIGLFTMLLLIGALSESMYKYERNRKQEKEFIAKLNESLIYLGEDKKCVENDR